ncbi:MAG: LexA family transcriptional regulator [Candidatus Marinimicrobia bacterium]|nr:LexA family transcriptional regulator [Candidatus Neomarinimicrobiota bacterium]
MSQHRLSPVEKMRRLREFLRREQRFPSHAELAALYGYTSKNAAARWLRRLEQLGYAVRGAGGKWRQTSRLLGRTRLLGAVTAGFPSPAEEELVDTLSLDEYLIERPEATFMLTVTGDSMRDAGILPGDLVLVERGAQPHRNDVVVAQVDREWTLKYFGRDRQGVYLDPANPAYQRIRPRESLVMGGVVRAVVRKYR